MINRRKITQDFTHQQGDEEVPLITSSVAPVQIQERFRPQTNQFHLLARDAQPRRLARNAYNEQSAPFTRAPTLSNRGNNFAPIHTYQTSPSIRNVSNNFNNADSRTIEITNLDSHKHQGNTEFICYTVQPGDTLQNIAVKYSCPVASIKRLNNLWSDQEFYGLSRLKLPVGKLRLIADVLDTEKLPTASRSERHGSEFEGDPHHHDGAANQFYTSQYTTDRRYEKQPSSFESSIAAPLNESRVEESIFKNYDLSIEKVKAAARSYNDNASAIMQTLAQSGNKVATDEDLDSIDPNKMAQREAEILLNDMSDYGLSFSGLILFIFIVCLICPLAYFIYLEENHHDPNKAL